MRNFSGAIFGQLDWAISDKRIILFALRLNFDQKRVDFKRKTYGGLQTNDSILIALQRMVYSNQNFVADIHDWNVSGQFTIHYNLNKRVRVYGTYSIGFKPVGLNLNGLPTHNGRPLTNLAIVKPERVNHFEFGLKAEPVRNSTLRLTIFFTDI